MPSDFLAASDEGAAPCPARSRFGLLVGSVFRQWRRQVDASFKTLELSDATRMPLLALYVQPQPMRQKELADTLHLDSSSLVRVLSQLRERQLLDWQADPADRRSKCITLTDAGREVAAQILARSLAIEQQLLAGISPEDLATTRRVLQQIAQRFELLDA